MKNFQFAIFKKIHPNSKVKNRFKKALETTIKTIIILSFPIPTALLAFLAWTFIIFDNGIHFDDGMEVLVTAAWIPVFGIIYSLLTAIVIATVWNEYKAMRAAVKKWDFDTFMDLRDEEMSPLVHSMVITLSVSLLVAFMILKYPNFHCGAILVTSTAYLLGLIFFVIREIDNPCSGLWFIRSIPEEWLDINPKLWREKRSEKAKKEFKRLHQELMGEQKLAA